MNIPLPIVNEVEQKPLADIVEEIISLKTGNPTANASALESEIDHFVYKLYGLTEEEIRIVEGKE